MNEPVIRKVGIRDVEFGAAVTLIEPVNLYGCTIGDGCFIGPFFEIQTGVQIGPRTRVQSHAFVCELVEIGADCFIGHGVTFINDSFSTGGPARGRRELWGNTVGKVRAAQWVADHYSAVTSSVRSGLQAADAVHALFGTSLMSSLTKGARALSGNKIPLWNPHMPKGAPPSIFRDIRNGSDRKVVYFPSCVVRTMGPSRKDKDQRTVFDAVLSVLDKAGYDVLFPDGMEDLCCGMPFESKGFFEQSDQMSRELEKALLDRSNNGEYPVLCDTSPCLYRMRRALRSNLKLYEPVEFICRCILCP